jgi:MFS transporter, VNT family, synaptic vesicle glycoprotein 2
MYLDAQSSTVTKVPAEKCRQVNFEEALRRTGFGKFNYILVILSGAVLSTVLLETLGISFILPVAECDLNLSTKDKGLLSAIAFAGIIASSHLWGFLADTKGRRKVILPTLFISFFITIVSSFVKSFWIFTLLRFFSGLFISGGSATIYAYLGEFHNLKSRSRVLMGAAFVFGVFCLCLPLLAFIVLNQEWEIYIAVIDVYYKPWRFFIAVCGSLSAICGICLFFLPESPKFVFATVRRISLSLIELK